MAPCSSWLQPAELVDQSKVSCSGSEVWQACTASRVKVFSQYSQRICWSSAPNFNAAPQQGHLYSVTCKEGSSSLWGCGKLFLLAHLTQQLQLQRDRQQAGDDVCNGLPAAPGSVWVLLVLPFAHAAFSPLQLGRGHVTDCNGAQKGKRQTYPGGNWPRPVCSLLLPGPDGLQKGKMNPMGHKGKKGTLILARTSDKTCTLPLPLSEMPTGAKLSFRLPEEEGGDLPPGAASIGHKMGGINPQGNSPGSGPQHGVIVESVLRHIHEWISAVHRCIFR